MSVLTFDVGGTPITVNCQRAGHAAPRKVGGDRVFSFSGAETASTRGEAMVVPVVLEMLSPATVATIRALFALGAQVPCAGDVFNNGGVTQAWSATITDELHETAAWWTLSMTLYECAPANLTTLDTSFIWLTKPTSPDDPGDGSIKVAYVGANVGGLADLASLRVMDATTAVELECGNPASRDPSCDCPTVESVAPERSWMTAALVATEIVGLMTLSLLSKGGTADKWAHQGVKANIVLVRAGVDVESIFTDWATSNGGFAGSTITMTTIGAVAWDVQANDKIRIEIWGRLALHCGYQDGNDGSNLDRQTITYGQGGTGYIGHLTVGGIVTLL